MAEFERCWTNSESTDPQKMLKVDLRDVEFIDEKGEALLERLFLEGAELHADDVFLRSVIAQIIEHLKSVRENGRTGVTVPKETGF